MERRAALPVTFLRFIAAAAVVILHFGRGVSSLAWANRLWDHGNLAVSFFFTLSGFVLAYAHRGGVRSVRSFYVARLARIVPLYWLALAGTIAYARHIGACDPRAAMASALMIQAWLPGYALMLNWPGWSLSAELFFYLVFPFVFARVRRLTSAGVIALGLGVWTAEVVLAACLVSLHPAPHSQLEEFAFCSPIVHLGTFVLGVCSGVLFARGWHVQRRAVLWAGAIVLALVLHGGALVAVAQNGLFAPLFVVVIWGTAAHAREPAGTALLGEASYGLYILQAPIALWCGVFAPHSHPNAFFWGLFALLVGASIVSYKLVEVPAREWIKGWASPRHSVPARHA